MKVSEKKVGVLVPYSGIFPGLKSAFTQPFKVHGRANGYELIIDYINQGDVKTVEKAVQKLCYQEEVDVITGYLASHVADKMAAQVQRYPDCQFMPCTIGEVIYVQQPAFPANYQPVSYKAWQLQVMLGSMVGSHLKPESCMVCTSVYDCGYSMHECFRFGLQGVHPIETVSSILKNDPGVIDTTPLIAEIKRVRPAHIYVLLCGKVLQQFLELFDREIDYRPTLSFAFPVNTKGLELSHPSFSECFTVYNNISRHATEDMLTNVYGNIFKGLAEKAASAISGATVADNAMIVEMDLVSKKARDPELIYQYADVKANLLEAANAIPSWFNPYLCI